MKSNGMNKYVKAGIWTLLAEILVRAVSFLATPVFARILPMGVYGDVKTFESWLNLLVPILSLGLYINVEVAEHDFKGRFKEYVASIMTLDASIHVFIVLFAIVFHRFICDIMDFTPVMLAVCVLYSCFYSIIIIYMRSQRIVLNYQRVAFTSMMASVPSMVISVIACLVFVNRLDDTSLLNLRVVTFYLPIIIFGFCILVLSVMKNKNNFNKEYWKYGIKVSVPLIMYQISLQILTQSDRVMIKNIVSSEKAAIFSIATTVIYIIEILDKGLNGTWIPWLYNHLEDKSFKTISLMMGGIIAIEGFICFFIGLLGNEVIYFFGGKKYLEGVWLLGPMMAGAVFHFLMLKLVDIEKFYHKESYVGTVSIGIAVVNLGLNYLGIKLFGYQAASYTTAISYVIAVFVHSILIKKHIPDVHLSYKLLYMIATGLGVLLILIMGLYDYSNMIRYIIFAVLGFISCGGAFIAYTRYKVE